ncbi:MAG: 3-oxoacyl-ACP reductase FabG [Lautropia sp.]
MSETTPGVRAAAAAGTPSDTVSDAASDPAPRAPLRGKVALVTGATRGIGAAIATALVRSGATVIGTATTADGAARVSATISATLSAARSAGLRTAGPAAADGAPSAGEGVVLDVTDRAACQALVDRVVATYGGLSILVNNAGITRDNLAMRMKDAEWDDVIDTNLGAVFRLCRLALKPMMKARDGRIVNITSVVGSSGNPGQANYAAAKAGVAGMTRSLAQEIGSRNITVNCVAPGFIDTDMTRALSPAQVDALKARIPLGRLGAAQDVAAAVVFLAGPGAAYITGALIPVNGGMYMG